jgi:beta-mannosidase
MQHVTRRDFLMQAGTSVVAGISSKSLIAEAATKPQGFERREISGGWRIKSIAPCAFLNQAQLAEAASTQDEEWLAITAMPAMVHDVLLSHRKIETPWLPGCAEKCRWVAERDWLYAATFTSEGPKRRAFLRFDGLDTIVDVYLNGRKIAMHSTMYQPLVVDVSDTLSAHNSLILHFHTVFDLSGVRPEPIRYLSGERTRPVRRTPQNYSNYLGPWPSFSRVGVYDRIYLETSEVARLTEVVTSASLDKSLEQGAVQVELTGIADLKSVEVRLRLLDSDARSVCESRSTIPVQNGTFVWSTKIQTTHPKLWWPRGYGSQPLYKLEVTVSAAGKSLHTEQRTIGFRRITMPEHLHFVVNNVPVKLWGAVWVTPDWQTEVWDPSRVEKLFALAENANFNALRVWGEVNSPRDDFYEMADAHGILLWQDFTELPLAADEESRSVCRSEADSFIKRLKHHPSILCWCGKNESAMWFSKDYNDDFKDHGPWPGLVAANEVGEICNRLDPERYYQPSTPFGGAFPNDPQAGNTHGYTNIWFVPGYDYLNFASEDTRISAPTLGSLNRFMTTEELWPDGYSTIQLPDSHLPFPRTWTKYTTSEAWKKTGPVEQFYDSTDAAGLVYRLGMASALYYRDTIERQRRGRDANDSSNRRRCGGYLAWKFNDSWPQVYSAKIDYFLEPYHVYYAMRRAYAPVLLSFDIGTYIHVWVVNDTTNPISGTVNIQLLHLDRNTYTREVVRDVRVEPGESVVVIRLDQAGIASFRREHILVGTFTSASGEVIARSTALVDIERRITFPDAKIEVQSKGNTISMTADKFAHCVALEGGGDGWLFDDNYFDLVPGETKTVRVLGNKSNGKIDVRSWYSKQKTALEWRP